MSARSALLVLACLVAACDDKPSAPHATPPPSAPAPVAGAPPASPPSAPAPAASAPVPDQIVCQQVLVGYKGATKAKRGLARTKDEAKARATVVAGLAKDSPEDFDELVKKFSDDPSAERLGTTGLVRRTDLVKPFADAAFSLQIGQISGVVESPFGFHVIKRTQ